MFKRTPFLAFICLLSLLTLTNCASDKKADDSTPGATAAAVDEDAVDKSDKDDKSKIEPVEKLYNKAAAKLDNKEYFEAAKGFDEVDRQYPYSQWATRAQLMAGYAHYKNLKYDEAMIALDRYIELHPGDQDIAYAYYLKALCAYEQITDVRRDQEMTEKALDSLKQVVQRFPDSKYAKDAALKIDLTTDHLAGKEMEIGRYYQDRKQYQAAINRFQRVVEQYQTTTHLPEALHRMTESFLALGLVDEARRTAAILGHNYPNSSWYKDSYRLLGGKVDPATGTVTPEKKSLYDKTLGRIF